MSDTSVPPPNPVPPHAGGVPSRQPPRRNSALGILFVLSLLLNLVCFFILVALCAGAYLFKGSLTDESTLALRERHYSGSTSVSQKVAIVAVEDVLIEGRLDFMEKQIEQAAADDDVKAVVVRIVSPGGSITASDDIHRRLTKLRDGDSDKARKGKPLVVSMGALAASGGYYIAMPGQTIYAEPTTLTGSIGVFASFPNVKDLSDKIGFRMEVVKAGAMKTSGSPFHEMKPEERALWEEMVEHAYAQFKEVVEKGRPQLKGQLEAKVVNEPRTVSVTDKEGQTKPVQVQYVRQRADGGIFTADKAKDFGLVDQIGYLADAATDAANRAGLAAGSYEVIKYERPKTLMSRFLEVEEKSQTPANALDPAHLAAGLTPRLWYLAPQAELAGIVSAGGR